MSDAEQSAEGVVAESPEDAPASASIVVPPSSRPSGIKPPSKIGRLCSSATPKPAVPASPRVEGGAGDAARKYSEDFGRKQLSDLVEADEELDSFLSTHGLRSSSIDRKASTSSTYSVTSLDGLWERHPRRLSEAGLRRSSEHSVVLTEDTDSFIIGERVWVGGSKPGQIAYIGETQFAPGDWAGIVLDDAIGKNDGSVAGIRYFQCAARRGVFSRLTRLTRYPLTPPSPSTPPQTLPPTPTTPGSVTSNVYRNISPARSVRSIASSRMTASLSTLGGSADKGELRLGERVIVSSSQGSKAGILRYWGIVDFANGIWAGVELDDPIGKNDGSVEGKRYFECGPRFGLFAPATKVSRSPSRRRPGNCAIHSPATPRRSSSRESLTSQGTSLATSVASSRIPSRAPLSAQVQQTPVTILRIASPTMTIIVCFDFKINIYKNPEISEPSPDSFSTLFILNSNPKNGQTDLKAIEDRISDNSSLLKEDSSVITSIFPSVSTDKYLHYDFKKKPLLKLKKKICKVNPTAQDLNRQQLVPPVNKTYFANFGRSYHYSCVSPSEFRYPYVVYIS